MRFLTVLFIVVFLFLSLLALVAASYVMTAPASDIVTIIYPAAEPPSFQFGPGW